MTDPLPRLNRPSYQDHQLLTLADFNDEQSFHLVSRDLAQRMLWSAGVLTGLAVANAPAAAGHLAGSGLSIGAGVALDSAGRLLVMTSDSALNLDDPAWYAVGQTRSWVLAISFVEQPNAAGNRWAQTGTLALVAAGALPPNALPLAGLAITAAQTAPSSSGAASVVQLQVVLDASLAKQATLQPERLPPIQTSQLLGQLSPDQLPEVPASKVTGAFTPDQIPDVPASKVTGAFTPDQIPDVPASKVTGSFTPDQIPDLPASKITGELAIAQLPVLPPSSIAGPLDEHQIPALTGILARLTALEAAVAALQPHPPAPGPDAITVAAGDNQVVTLAPSTAGHPIAQFAPIRFQVTTADGKPAANVSVEVSLGSVQAPLIVQIRPTGDQSVTVVTDTLGMASLALMGGYSAWAYSGSGQFTLIATIKAAPQPVSATVHLTANLPPPGPQIPAPTLVGMAPDRANATATRLGLTMQVLGVMSRPGVPDNIIVRQSPMAGAMVAASGAIGVYLSSLSQPDAPQSG